MTSGDDVSPRPRGWPRPAKVAVAVLVPCMLLLVASPFAARGWWERQRRAVLADLARDGMAVDPAAMRPLPDGPNGADQVAKAIQALDGLPEAVSFMLTTATPLQLRNALADPTSDDASWVFTPDARDPRCPPDLAGALRLVEERLDRVERDLDRALAGPVVFPVAWTRGLEVEMPHLAGVRQLCLGLVVRGAWRALQGRGDDAWADMERLLALVPAVDGPSLSCRLVRHAVLGLACDAVRDLLSLAPPPGPERQARLAAALELLEERDGFQRAMRGELGLAEATFGGDLSALAGDLGKDGAAPLFVARFLVARWSRDYARVQADVIRATAGEDPVLIQAELERLEQEARQGTVLVRLLVPALSRAWSKELDALTRARATRVALGLAARGELPERAGGLPADPWHPQGGPLRYARRGPREAAVWSVGRDRVDDQGRAPDPDAKESEETPGVDLVIQVRLPD